MDSGAKYSRFGKDADTPDAIQLHFHIAVAIGIAEVSQVRPPRRILGISFHNDCIFIQGLGQSQRRLRFLPRI